jgi:hypothetical protein
MNDNKIRTLKVISLLASIIFVLLIGVQFASATLEPVKQNECVDLLGSSDSTASMNLSSITYPNQTTWYQTIEMTKNDKTFSYHFCDTSQLGGYVYNYYEADGTTWINDFTVTPSGLDNVLGYFILCFIIVYSIGFIGFFGKNEWISIIGGLAMISLGTYVILNGIDVYRTTLTDVIAWWTIALGAFFSLYAAVAVIQDNM